MKIDLLMMTQGWRNYLWNSVRYSNHPLYPVEKGFYVEGIISDNTKESLINIIDMKSGATDIVQVNKSRFTCDLPLFYDNHVFLIQGKYKKDKAADYDILLDTASTPEIKYRNNELPYFSYKQGYIKDLNEIFKNDSISEPPEKYIPIPEVVVKARLRPWYSKPDKVINLEKIDPTGKKYVSLLQMIEEQFGEKAFIESVDSMGNPKLYPPILVVNGNPLTDTYCEPCHSLNYGWALRIPVNEILDVKFYEAGSDYSQFLTPPAPPPPGTGPPIDPENPPPKNKYAIILPALEHRMLPVVSFTTYYNSFRGTPAGMVVFPFQGIYKAKEFYHPDKNSTGNNKVDTRSTIYWNPEVNTDSTGTAKISFYNSDLNGKAIIKVCGMSFQAHDAGRGTSNYVSK
jgi:hypothetical protein